MLFVVAGICLLALLQHLTFLSLPIFHTEKALLESMPRYFADRVSVLLLMVLALVTWLKYYLLGFSLVRLLFIPFHQRSWGDTLKICANPLPLSLHP